jgi:predicted negative regulator of RcsB-dependent stress response
MLGFKTRPHTKKVRPHLTRRLNPAKLMFYNHLGQPRRFFKKVQSYTRRQLKEDKFAKGTQEAVHWATEHRQLLIWSISAVVVAGILVTGYLTWNSHQTEQANIELSKALQTFSAPLRPAGSPPDPSIKTYDSIAERGKDAQKEFQAVADQFPHTKPGKMARYLAGTAAIDAGDNATAERLLKSAAEESDKNVASLAKLALANFYRANNRTVDAAKLYKELIDNPTDTVSKGRAQLELAALYESTDPKEAANIYQQIQKESPASPAGRIAASKLAGAAK